MPRGYAVRLRRAILMLYQVPAKMIAAPTNTSGSSGSP